MLTLPIKQVSNGVEAAFHLTCADISDVANSDAFAANFGANVAVRTSGMSPDKSA
jgi:hypothetical protein